MSETSWMWFILPIVGWLLFIQIRYMARQYRSVRWPVADATLQKGPLGFVPIGRGNGSPAFFMGYVYTLNGSKYAGLFALYGSEKNVERVYKEFPNGTIRVQYDPTNPSVSYLADLRDPRFDCLTPTQNPAHLSNAPLFDLQQLIRQ